MNPSDLSNGTEVYFKLGTDTVFKGVIVGVDELQKHYSARDYPENANLARVDIDQSATYRDDGTPDHMAPESYQPQGEDAVFRDAYTIDAEEQHYIITEENLVEVIE